MASNQSHGKRYEDYIKAGYPRSADHERPPNAQWDIESEYDEERKLPTSIKTTGHPIICMADARRWWLVDSDFRLIVGRYRQESVVKIFYRMYEFIISRSEIANMRGDVTLEEIENFHNGLRMFGKGKHKEARQWAKEQKKLFEGRTMIMLNPKIDSKKQRRLQCSFNLNKLVVIAKEHKVYQENEYYKGMSVGFKIESGLRKFGKNNGDE